MKYKNYLIPLTKALHKKDWDSDILWKMITMIAEDTMKKGGLDLSHEVFKRIYNYSNRCKSLTELEDYLDRLQY